MKLKERKILFTKVLENHKEQIYKVCWGFTTEHVDDLFQETILNVWKGIESYESKASLNSWVYRVAFNTCLLWKRKAKRSVQLDFTDDKLEPSENTASIEAKLINTERIQILMRAIRSLDKLDRSIALLLLEDLSYKEIAEITGTSTNNIGVKIHRIKEKLKKILS